MRAELWTTLQADRARLSTNSRQTVVQDSDHEIHLFRPQTVVDAIADVAEAARTGAGLRARSN